MDRGRQPTHPDAMGGFPSARLLLVARRRRRHLWQGQCSLVTRASRHPFSFFIARRAEVGA